MKVSRRNFIVGAAGTIGARTAAAVTVPANAAALGKRGALGKFVGELPPGRYDAHVHVYPGEPEPEKLVRSFAEAGLAGGCIFSGCPVKWEKSWPNPLPPAGEMDRVIEWASLSPAIYPFYWIDPVRPDACELVDMAVEKGIYGFKVIRSEGRPVDEKSLPVYRRIAHHGKPVTFHSGILWDGRPSSDNFRPANWEGMLAVPGLRFALAHISWPWCDECIAVYGKLLNAILERGDKVPEMFIDITPGTPKIYRRDALVKLHTVGYDIRDHVMFGSDCRVSDYNGNWTKDWMATDGAIYAELGLDGGQIDSIYRKSLERYLFGGDNSSRSIPTPDGVDRD
jgi:predicted TIM-barrel fold metal-dependent hydrolase